VKLFFLSSHRDMSWNEAEKNSLLQLSPLFLSLNYAWSSWWSYFTKHFFHKHLTVAKWHSHHEALELFSLQLSTEAFQQFQKLQEIKEELEIAG